MNPGGKTGRERYALNVGIQSRPELTQHLVNTPIKGSCSAGRAPARKQTLLTPGGQFHASKEMIDVPRLVLIDAETGTRVRHRIRSIKQALKQQEWYEAKLGRRVRIEKVFEDRAAPGKTDSHTGRA